MWISKKGVNTALGDKMESLKNTRVKAHYDPGLTHRVRRVAPQYCAPFV